MPLDTACSEQPPMPQIGGVMGLQQNTGKSSLTKQRYVELVQLGKIASDELIKHGLQRHEYCCFGEIMQKIMQLE